MSNDAPGRHDQQDAPRESRAGRSRRARVALIALGAIVAVAAVGGAVYALTRKPDTARAAGPVSVSPKLPPVEVAPETGRTLSHDDPLRLWVGGDSLAGSFGPALGDTLDATGIVQTGIDYKVSSGLADDGLRNWPAHATEQMEQRDPEAVAFIIGANDTAMVTKTDANRDGVHDWEPRYRERVATMMDTFVGGDKQRTVFWLGPPTLADKNMNAATREIGRLMKDEAAKHGPNVIYVDTYALFEGEGGGYDRRIQDERNVQITARIPDGVHFSEAGAQYLARMTFTLLDARYRISAQADPSQPITWEFATPDAEQVPGYTAVPRPRSGTGGNGGRPATRGTTPPTTNRGNPGPATSSPGGGGSGTTAPRPTETSTPKPTTPKPTTPPTTRAG